ncbi:hypothetical protein OROGR_004056 [Orobanche gracilis]
MTGSEEPLLSRLSRLDNILKQLECVQSVVHSPKSSYASTTSSGTLTSDGRPPSLDDFSLRGFEKHCRPLEEVMLEVESKGTLIERLGDVEERILKGPKYLEEGFEAGREKEQTLPVDRKKSTTLKNLVKSCVMRTKHEGND